MFQLKHLCIPYEQEYFCVWIIPWKQFNHGIFCTGYADSRGHYMCESFYFFLFTCLLYYNINVMPNTFRFWTENNSMNVDVRPIPSRLLTLPESELYLFSHPFVSPHTRVLDYTFVAKLLAKQKIENQLA